MHGSERRRTPSSGCVPEGTTTTTSLRDGYRTRSPLGSLASREIRLPRAIIGALLGLYRFVITVSLACRLVVWRGCAACVLYYIFGFLLSLCAQSTTRGPMKSIERAGGRFGCARVERIYASARAAWRNADMKTGKVKGIYTRDVYCVSIWHCFGFGWGALEHFQLVKEARYCRQRRRRRRRRVRVSRRDVARERCLCARVVHGSFNFHAHKTHTHQTRVFVCAHNVTKAIHYREVVVVW